MYCKWAKACGLQNGGRSPKKWWYYCREREQHEKLNFISCLLYLSHSGEMSLICNFITDEGICRRKRFTFLLCI